MTDIEESSIIDSDIEQKKVNNKKEENISDIMPTVFLLQIFIKNST